MGHRAAASRSTRRTASIPVDPAATLKLDAEKLAALPEGYRHLAYMQELIGYKVKRDMPGLTGAEVEKLYAQGRDWLARQADLSHRICRREALRYLVRWLRRSAWSDRPGFSRNVTPSGSAVIGDCPEITTTRSAGLLVRA